MSKIDERKKKAKLKKLKNRWKECEAISRALCAKHIKALKEADKIGRKRRQAENRTAQAWYKFVMVANGTNVVMDDVESRE